MARPRKNAASPPSKLSSGQASYVLDRLIKERRVSQTDISRYVSEMAREISDLEERLKHLYDAVGSAASSAASSIAAAAVSTVNAVRRGRKPGRPSGRPPGRPPGSGRGPGRPPGVPGRKPGRPPASASAAGLSSGDAGSSAGTSTGAATSAKRGRKRSAITSEQLASRQLQGRYLALVRRFPASRRATFARTAKEKGREAAIKEMQDALPKK
jgi:hypothetical protein